MPKVSKGKLTDKQIRFSELVARGMTVADAYKKAYNYNNDSVKMLNKISNRLYNQNNIQNEICKIREMANNEEKIDGIPMNEQLRRTVDKLNKEDKKLIKDELVWTQSIAFGKMKELLDSCESSTELLKDRPRLFSEVRTLIRRVEKKLQLDERSIISNEKILADIQDCLEHIEDITYKLSKFDVRDYNGTVNTMTSLMKEMNAITGVNKNAGAMKNINFEDKLLNIINTTVKTSDNKNLAKDLEAFAFDEE